MSKIKVVIDPAIMNGHLRPTGRMNICVRSEWVAIHLPLAGPSLTHASVRAVTKKIAVAGSGTGR